MDRLFQRHAGQFFHAAALPFTIHVGGEAEGQFADRHFHWRIPGEIGLELVRDLSRQGFDLAFSSTAKIDYAIGIPLTHPKLDAPVLPIYVNAYLPPHAQRRVALTWHDFVERKAKPWPASFGTQSCSC